MKLLASLLAASVVSAGSILRSHTHTQDVQTVLQHPELEEKYLIELSPGEVEWITEDQKWEYKRVRSLICRRNTTDSET